MKTVALLAMGLLSPLLASAQFALTFDPSVPVVANGSPLNMAWAGGLNFPQISDIDLDGDGDKDLFLFDRSGNKVVTLRSNAAQGQNTYTFTHDFEAVAQHGAALFDAGRDTLLACGHPLASARRIVPHQASGAVAGWFAARFGVPSANVCDHGRRVGNLGSASIWAALNDVFPALAPGERALFLGAEATQYSFGGFALTR